MPDSRPHDDSAPPAPPRILLVEDYQPNVLVVTMLLERFGYGWDVADNGEDAVRLARRGGYVACLMDVEMLGMNGYEATMAIRDFEAHEKRPRLTIIGVTAHALSGDRQKCLDAGMDDYIAKPFLPSDLQTKLLRLVEA